MEIFNNRLADRWSLPVVVDYPERTLDTHTQALHKKQAIPQNPRKSAVSVESYSGFESSLPDQFTDTENHSGNDFLSNTPAR